jgi:hypothetical protein
MDADNPPEGGAKPGAEDDAAAKPADGKDGADAKPGDSRFDKHPRFIELNDRMKAAEERSQRLEQQNSKLLEQMTQLQASTTSKGSKPEKDELPYKDTSKMSDDELLDWQSDDPKGYHTNLQKMVEYQIQKGIEDGLKKTTEQSKKEEFETKVEKTFSSYAKENPDFDSMWDKGEIQAYMEEHPGHNAISAHMALTAENRMQAKIDEAVAKALEEADTARRSTRKAGAIIPAGPGTTPSAPAKRDAELANPKQFGGATSVLAARLERRRAQAGL